MLRSRSNAFTCSIKLKVCRDCSFKAVVTALKRSSSAVAIADQ
jgi:hypothetical protein